MRVVSVAFACVLFPSLVGAEGKDPVAREIPKLPDVKPVIGGQDAPPGKWDDCGAVFFGPNSVACSGTLIAPDVALTAGHCNDSTLSAILVGTNSLNRQADGEKLTVVKRVPLIEADITVLVLGQKSSVEPRALATGWSQLEIKNGAPVAIVGFGTTNRNGSIGTDTLKEAESTITDFDCSTHPGCSDFELGAGGMGIDSCPGDSGGPLYVLTDFGDFLTGVTSRAYRNATSACGEGGIYGRADQLVDQIEKAAGKKVTRGREPIAENVVAIRGSAGETTIDANDPKSDSHTFKIEEQPAIGRAAVRDDGVVRVCVDANATPGNDEFVLVTVTDTKDPKRKVTARVGISVAANEPVGGTCDPNAFETESGGCCDSGGRGAGGSALLGLLVVFGIRRRRK